MKITDVIINESPEIGDSFGIELGNTLIESQVVGFTEDGVIVEADDKALALMHMNGAQFESVVTEGRWFRTGYGWAGGYNEKTGQMYKHPDLYKKAAEKRAKRDAEVIGKPQPTDQSMKPDVAEASWADLDQPHRQDAKRIEKSFEGSNANLFMEPLERTKIVRSVIRDLGLNAGAIDTIWTNKLRDGSRTIKFLHRGNAKQATSLLTKTLSKKGLAQGQDFVVRLGMPTTPPVLGYTSIIVHLPVQSTGVAEAAAPTEKVGDIIKRVLGNQLTWEPGVSKMYKNTRRSKTQRVDDYIMKNIRVNAKIKTHLSANRGDVLAVALKNELIKSGYPVYGDVLIFSDQVMFQTRIPITVTAEQEHDKKQGLAEGEYDETELYHGAYVRDEQDGSGEVFRMTGDPLDRRVRIEDRNGSGWYISPSRLTLVDEDDPAIARWFGGDDDEEDVMEDSEKRVRDLLRAIGNTKKERREWQRRGYDTAELDQDLMALNRELRQAERRWAQNDRVDEAGMIKKLKRAANLWDGPAHLKDVIDYVRNAPDDVLVRFAKGKEEIPYPHTPRALQIKLINQELKRRFGLTPKGNIPQVDETADPKIHLKRAKAAADKDEQELYVKHLIRYHTAMKKQNPADAAKHDERITKLKRDIGEILEQVSEAKYQGREVPLGKPMKGDVAKSKVYVRGPKGNVVKVNFGDKKMRIKKSNPKRRKSFRARHRCANPGPRWKARYWSCRAW